ncbi:hypothetical protein BGZ61DRAFT_483419 [Ilyonectria robusta]|uniref:uncharacterized protein n=1 Tax=Ilyonectria robusta TaxID=1079257 RepID=UPI001E8CB247|nr:uncharacterized protein BGZ61DRAFT_483419 [Ilyonectria robusta]KAH8669229.1 hypothetical protein BGZ61DRAFT_483419 [Ilyonectria robusta]
MAENKRPYSEEPNRDEKAAARNLIPAHNADIAARRPGDEIKNPLSTANLTTASPSTMGDYGELRKEFLSREKALDFDYNCQQRGTPDERLADAIIQRLKAQDEANVYGKAHPRTGYGGQPHPRFAGDHFLSNRELIEQTALFRVARRMPKGGHLHIHFNACLPPQVLLDIAKGMDRMFIMSNMPLISDNGCGNFDRCEFQFQLRSPEKESPGDLFSVAYQPGQTMKFRDFMERFPGYYDKATVDDWLLDKLMFHEEEAHNYLQTASGAWAKFNGRTRMMKGLFNYETAYKAYTRRLLENFMDDNITYAEIRPKFMMSNQLWKDNGTERTNNEGFDLVGEESKGRPIKDFAPKLLAFQEKCADQGVEIPFLFHCGETLDMGKDTDGNLVDALLLKSKRVGRGFALAKHPYIMQHMKDSDNGTLFRSTLSHDFYQVMVGKADMGLFGWKQLILWSLEHACLFGAEYDRVYSQWEQEWVKFVEWVIREYGNDYERDCLG